MSGGVLGTRRSRALVPGGRSPGARPVARGPVRVPAWAVIVAAMSIGVVACWPSLRTLGAALRGTDSASLATLGPLAALATVLVAISRNGAPERPKLEPAMVGAAPLLAVALALTVFGPARFGFGFWLVRLDLVAATAFLVGVLVLAMGVRATIGSHGSWIALMALVPPVTLPVFATLERVVGDATRNLAATFTSAIDLGVRHLEAGRFEVLSGGGGDGTRVVSVADACGGVEGIAVVAMFAGPILVGTSGGRWRRVVLVLAALLAAWLLNLARVLLLLGLAGGGHERLFALVHGWAGAVVALVLVAALVLVPGRMGMAWRGSLAGLRTGVEYTGSHARWGLGTVLVLGTLVGMGQWSHSAEAAAAAQVERRPQLEWAPASLRGTHDERHVDLRAAGYDVRHDDQYQWFRQYFGAASQASSFTISRAGEAPVWAQLVVSPSRRALDQFGPVDCFIAHGATVYRVRRVDLPGGSGIVVDQRQRQERFSALSWTQPVRMPDGSAAYLRVVLFAMAGRGADQRQPEPEGAIERTAFGVLNRLSPLPTRDTRGYEFGPAARQLNDVATSLLKTSLAAGDGGSP